MGGIAGIIRFDGQDIDPAETESIVRVLKHRGNLATCPLKNGIFLAFGGMAEPSVVTSTIAVVDADTSFSRFSHQSFSDHYARVGPASFNSLDTDFALALWDERQQNLYCARDIVGVKPLYYIHKPGSFFAFASEIKALTVLREVHVRPNRHQFRAYLSWDKRNLPYGARTFYEDIYNVLPGHYLKVSAEKTEETAYWKPDFERFHGLEGVEAYASLFKDYFTDAIAKRIQGKLKIGAHLSGGLDSSSVSSVAQSLLIPNGKPSLSTFNIDTEQPLAEEQEYVQDVVNQWHTNHFKLKPLPDILDSVNEINRIFDRPEHFIIPSSFHLSVSAKAKRLGCDMILTGHGGDNVATSGFSLIDDLVNAGDWNSLLMVNRKYFDFNKQSFLDHEQGRFHLLIKPGYEKYVLSLITSDLRNQYGKESLPSLWSRLIEHKQRFGVSGTSMITYLTERVLNKLSGFRPIDDALSEDFKREVRPKDQRSTGALLDAILAETGTYVGNVLNHNNVMFNEQMNHIGAYYGHDYSHPFFDKNVIELCLATPLVLSFDEGRGRGLIRHGMQHVLPSSVRNRSTKANFVEYGTLSAQQLYDATREQLSYSGHPIWGIVDRKVFFRIVSIVFNPRIPGVLKTRYNWQLSRIIYLAIWLNSIESPKLR